MQKLFTTTSLFAFFAASASIYADNTNAQIRNLENRVSALEQRKSATSMINPSGRPEVKNGADIFVTADFLIWQAHENGLGYVIKAKGPDLTDSSTKELHFNWDPGFRFGLGWNTPHDGWDVYANWTCYHTKARSNQQTTNSTLFPVFESGYYDAASGLSTPSYSYAKWRLNLNMIDLEMGREFFVSKWLTLRPFVGLRTAWIYQKLNCNYNGEKQSFVFGTLQADGFSTDLTYDYYVRDKNKYWGLGIRPGINTQWGLGRGFSFFGNTSLSILYGCYRQSQDQYFISSDNQTQDLIDNSHSTRVNVAIAELQLGIKWETMFNKDHNHFSVQAGWENFMFFNMNQFDRFIGETYNTKGSIISNQGDLTIQGYTVSFRFDF